MILVMGLGNFGVGYSRTRHNAGFICVQHIIEHLGLSCVNDEGTGALVAEARFSDMLGCAGPVFFKLLRRDSCGEVDTEVLFAMPATFMNLSSDSFRALLDRYDFSQVFVIYDDIDTRFGSVNFKRRSGSGGHNGVRSIQSISSDFVSVKLGIGSNLFLRSTFLNEFVRVLTDRLSGGSNFIGTMGFFEALKAECGDIVDTYVQDFRSYSKSSNLSTGDFVMSDFSGTELLLLPSICSFVKDALTFILYQNLVHNTFDVGSVSFNMR